MDSVKLRASARGVLERAGMKIETAAFGQHIARPGAIDAPTRPSVCKIRNMQEHIDAHAFKATARFNWRHADQSPLPGAIQQTSMSPVSPQALGVCGNETPNASSRPSS
ncbi:MAG: hypothetical protein M0D54_10635 [Hyphomonadaceae bacterium JAD_PAG50586_4]|nr:MAG: hypothetical protein M0D54_10635 [Hyphomonadaceae bacterium JAD_PAG50586_4]